MGNSLKIKRILISQPQPGPAVRSPFTELSAKYDVEVDYHPFIKVEPVSVKDFRSQRVDILAHTAIIFTNRSSVDHFFNICAQMRVTIPETMKYFCVTETIALYLQKYIVYRKRKIFFGKTDFTELMVQVLKHKDEKFLVPLPNPHNPEITQTLDKLRVKYTKAIMSNTVSADLDDVDIDKYDVMVFYSPAEISSLVAKFPGINGRPMIATFGNGTAVAAGESGLKVSVFAPTEQYPSMVNALNSFITKYNAGEELEDVVVEKKKADISHLKPVVKPTVKAAGKTAAKTASAKTKKANGAAAKKSSK